MRKVILVSAIICASMLAGACTHSPSLVVTTAPAVSEPMSAPQPTERPMQESGPTKTPEETPVPVKGTITVRGGDTLERDIIPQLCNVFALAEEPVKEMLSEAKSRLISDSLTGFRRMEGIIVPGRYEVTNETLSDYIALWITGAEQRFDSLLTACAEPNGLKAYEQLTLASIVDWECLSDEFQAEAAAVLLNRLNKGDKLQCCATVEYALGYSRPYLTSDDIKVQSDYNTYTCKGLPPGPICVVDEQSLAAGIGRSVDSSLYFFFYDYAPETLQVFSDYSAFKEKAKISKQKFLDKYDIGKYDMVDKRSYFFKTE